MRTNLRTNFEALNFRFTSLKGAIYPVNIIY